MNSDEELQLGIHFGSIQARRSSRADIGEFYGRCHAEWNRFVGVGSGVRPGWSKISKLIFQWQSDFYLYQFETLLDVIGFHSEDDGCVALLAINEVGLLDHDEYGLELNYLVKRLDLFNSSYPGLLDAVFSFATEYSEFLGYEGRLVIPYALQAHHGRYKAYGFEITTVYDNGMAHMVKRER